MVMTSPSDDGAPPRPARDVTTDDRAAPHPLYCVWEITRACDLGCKHCGSRAGPSRPGELSTEACLDVVRELDELGIREVTLIGGEAYLREDWHVIAAEITRRGMRCGMTAGARNLTAERIQRAVDAGIRTVSVSIDGLEATHDAQRGSAGSWRAAVEAARALAATPIRLAINTQINRLSMPELPAMASLLDEIGSKAWQIQLTVPMGHAAGRPKLLLQPYELLELYPLLGWVKKHRLDPKGIKLYPGNNIGDFGPYEQALRCGGDRGAYWQGCSADEWTLGLAADGKLQSYPFPPSDRWTGGHLGRDALAATLRTTPDLTYVKNRTKDDFWGFCRDCYYADVCKAGCLWTSYVLFGRDGNNPYCIHRAMEHDQRGQRERLTLAAMAPGGPFDRGRFKLSTEPSRRSAASTTAPGALEFSHSEVTQLNWDSSSIWPRKTMLDVLGGSSLGAGGHLTEHSLSASTEPMVAPTLRGSDPSLDVAQALLRLQSGLLHAHAEGVRTETEHDAAVHHLHQFRVALRRTRSVLKLIREVFPATLGKHFRKRFSWMGKITGPVRDLDVWLSALADYRATIPPAEAAHLGPLVERLEAERAVAHVQLLREFQRKRFHQTLRDWQLFVDAPYTEPDRPAEANEPISAPTSVAIANRYRVLVHSGSRVTQFTADGAVHAVRIEVKKLRYLVRLFGPLIADDLTKVNAGLKKLQRCLGSFNDNSVQLMALHRVLPELLQDPATTPQQLLALGQLMGHLRTGKQHDRARFLRRMAQVSSEPMQARYAEAFGVSTMPLFTEDSIEQVDVAEDSDEVT